MAPYITDRTARANSSSEKRELRSLFAPKASRILRVLLAEPERSWKTKDMAEEAGVSLRHVSNIKQFLAGKERMQRPKWAPT